jgi:hypothetical protein
MTGEHFYYDWKAVREQLQELVTSLEQEPGEIEQLREGMVQLARLTKDLLRALEVMSEEHSHTVKLMKEKLG